MFISQMDNQHLDNTIKLILSNIKSGKGLLNPEISISNFQQSLYGFDQNTLKKSVVKKMKYSVEKLYPYLAEAMLRGMNFTTLLQEIFERKEAELKIGILVNDDTPLRIEFQEDEDE